MIQPIKSMQELWSLYLSGIPCFKGGSRIKSIRSREFGPMGPYSFEHGGWILCTIAPNGFTAHVGEDDICAGRIFAETSKTID